MSELLEPRLVGLALILACLPAGVEAKMVGSLPANGRTLAPREAREAQILRLLAQEKIASALENAGLTAEEIRSRLDRLDDQQIERLASNLETIRSGKGGFFVLAAIGVAAIIVVGILTYFREG